MLADYRYYLKAVANLALYLVPFVVFLMGYQSFGMTTLLWTITGIGMAGVGMNVMHDAIHNNVTKSDWVNSQDWCSNLHVVWKLLHVEGATQHQAPYAY